MLHLRSFTHRLAFVCLALTPGCDDPGTRDAEDYRCEIPEALAAEIAAHPRAAEFQASLESLAATRLPGAVWAIRDGNGTWAGAVGSADMTLGVPLESCHRTRIASVTKSMVAVTVLRSLDALGIDLDDPIAPLLPPELASRVRHAETITVRQLLNHSSGLPDYTGFAWGIALFNDPTIAWTIESLLDQALAKDPQFDPGTRHGYANTNYLLLAEILEAQSGRDQDELMVDALFAPLELAQTSYRPDHFAFPGVVRGYLDLYGDRVLIDATETYATNSVDAAGGVASNAFDLLTFLDASFVDPDFIDPGLRAQIFDFLPNDSDHGFDGYGLGFDRWRTPWGEGVGHIGQELGYLTFAYHFPDADLSFVFWTNAASISNPTDTNLTGVVIEEILPQLAEVALVGG